MYTAQFTIGRIQKLIKLKGLVQKKVLSDCGISENTLKRMSDNKGMASFSLAKIADYLDVSVDYLLGRTDDPNTKGISNIIKIKGDNAHDISNINLGKASTEDIDEVVEMLKSLTLVQRSEAILMISKIKDKKE